MSRSPCRRSNRDPITYERAREREIVGGKTRVDTDTSANLPLVQRTPQARQATERASECPRRRGCRAISPRRRPLSRNNPETHSRNSHRHASSSLPRRDRRAAMRSAPGERRRLSNMATTQPPMSLVAGFRGEESSRERRRDEILDGEGDYSHRHSPLPPSDPISRETHHRGGGEGAGRRKRNASRQPAAPPSVGLSIAGCIARLRSRGSRGHP